MAARHEPADNDADVKALASRIEGRTQRLPVSSLIVDRLLREHDDDHHVNVLATSVVAATPIVIRRSTMAVIDGVHRLRAAVARGDTHVEAIFFDGSDREAFALAVRLNAQHGLALTRADRRRAVERLVTLWPEWSDRTIAGVAGVSPKTVGERRRTLGGMRAVGHRVGRDGRVRPLNVADRRRHGFEIFRQRPTASLREVASATGLSVSTVRDVRQRYESAEDPVPDRQRADSVAPGTRDREHPAISTSMTDVHARTDLVELLRADPSLRFSSSGRMVLRLLLRPHPWKALAASIPPHLVDLVAEAAQQCGRAWLEFSERVVAEHSVPSPVRESSGF